MKVTEINAKTILSKSGLPDADYAINPYVGCEFGCIYCYASFAGRSVNEPIENWGNYVYVKRNAVELLRKELAGMPASRRNASIFLSSVTDPYQGAESRYQLTRGILQLLASERYPGEISILTKSSLVLRDIDILKRLRNCEVGMTVTTADDALGRSLEVRAARPSQRLSTLLHLHDEGIRTCASVGPLLPHFRYRPELLDELFSKLAESKVDYVCVEHINLRPYIRKRLFDALKGEPKEVQDVYMSADDAAHRNALDRIVEELAKKHHLELAAGGAIYHNEYMDGWRKESAANGTQKRLDQIYGR
jgi:DNA repair photolyase